MKILLTSNPQNLAAVLATFSSTATVEAEYGSVTVSGSALTFAHHGKNAGNPCPCSYPNTVADGLGIEAIGVSHVDLDTLGGVLAIQGRKPEAPSFWELAEFVDLNGAHKLSVSGANAADLASLHAWWAWSEKNRLFAPRDGSVADAGAWIDAAAEAITAILAGDEALLALGEAHRKAGEALNASSFRKSYGDVLFRVSDAFANHLYADPQGRPYRAVVTYSPKAGSVTLSYADATARDNACKLLQEQFGPLAGGHKGIAGSPRGKRMGSVNARKVAKNAAFRLARA
jgi:hypothetical protein